MDTRTLLSAVVERLRLQLPGLHVDFFPKRPEQFRLNHSRGAVLVSLPM